MGEKLGETALDYLSSSSRAPIFIHAQCFSTAIKQEFRANTEKDRKGEITRRMAIYRYIETFQSLRVKQ